MQLQEMQQLFLSPSRITIILVRPKLLDISCIHFPLPSLNALFHVLTGDIDNIVLTGQY